jgi:hypothetical protein
MSNSVPENILSLQSYWESLAAGEAADRSAFDIAAVPFLLPYLMVCDLEFAPFRVRYRLSGTAVDEMTGTNLTGRYLDEFAEGNYAAAVQQISARYETVSQSGKPEIFTYAAVGENPNAIGVWAGIFPLKRNGVIDQCVSIEDYGELYDPQRSTRDLSAKDWAILSNDTFDTVLATIRRF